MTKYNKSKYPRMTCEYCGYTIGMNAYARSHGDICAYKDAKKGFKFCRVCKKEKSLKEFNKVSSRTYDGLNQSCKECASIKKLSCPYCGKTIITSYTNHKLVIKRED